MPLTKFTGATDTIQSLADKPNQDNGLSAAQLKAKFDQVATDTEAYLNNILTEELDGILYTPGGTTAEVIEARKGKASLKLKIDDIDSQLADIATVAPLIKDVDNTSVLSQYFDKDNAKIKLPSGTFFIKASDIINHIADVNITGKLTIEGDGIGKTIIKFLDQNSNAPLLKSENISYIHIRKLTLDGNCQQGLYTGFNRLLYILGCEKVNVHHVEFLNCGNGALSVVSSTIKQSVDIRVADCRFENINGIGIITKPSGAKNVIIYGNTFKKCGQTPIMIDGEESSNPYIDVTENVVINGNIIEDIKGDYYDSTGSFSVGIGIQENVKRIVVTNNIIKNILGSTGREGYGIQITVGQTDKIVQELIISNNIIDDVGTVGVVLTGGTALMQNIKISNNIIKSVLKGIYVSGTTAEKIINLTIDGNNISGIAPLTTLGHAIQFDSAVKTVLNCKVNNNNIKGVYGRGMYLYGKTIDCTDNTVSDCLGTSSVSEGIVVVGDNVNVENNNASENGTSGIYVNGCPNANINGNITKNNCKVYWNAAGIYIKSSPNSKINDNLSTDNQATKTQSYGLRLDAASTGCMARNNYLKDNKTSAILDDSTTLNTLTVDAYGNAV